MKTVLVAVVLMTAMLSPSAQRSSSRNPNALDDMTQTAKECSNGTSTLTVRQCAFMRQMTDALTQLNQLVDSGEYAKLPKATQHTMLSMVDALQTALPLVRQGR